MSVETLESFPGETSDIDEVDAGLDEDIEQNQADIEPEQSARETLSESAQESLRGLAAQDIEQAMSDIQARMEDQRRAEEYYGPLDKKIKKNNDKLQEISDAKKAEQDKNTKLGLSTSRKYKKLDIKESRAVYKHNKKARRYNQARKLITTNIAEKSTREWADDPKRQTDGYKMLVGDMDAIQAELQKRGHIREELRNPDLPAGTRASYEAEVLLWSDQSDSEYEAVKQREAATKYYEWLKGEERTAQLARFEDIREKLIERHEIIKKSQDESIDSTERGYYQTLVDSWGNNLDEFQQELIGDEIAEFRDWYLHQTDKELAAELKAIEKETAQRQKAIQQEQKLRQKAEQLAAKASNIMKDIESETDADALKNLRSDYEKAKEEYHKIQQRHEDIRKTIDDLSGGDLTRDEREDAAKARQQDKLRVVGL